MNSIELIKERFKYRGPRWAVFQQRSLASCALTKGGDGLSFDRLLETWRRSFACNETISFISDETIRFTFDYNCLIIQLYANENKISDQRTMFHTILAQSKTVQIVKG